MPSFRRRRTFVVLALLLASLLTAAPASANESPETQAPARPSEPPAPGTVTAHGGVTDHGPASSLPGDPSLVGIAAAADGDGYWVAAADGTVRAFGSAGDHGSAAGLDLAAPIVGIAAHPSRGGYWLVASDGGVFSFGAASFHGSVGGQRLHRPVVGMASAPDGDGYWLVASDGGVFSFGSADFHGSTGATPLIEPVVGLTPTPDGDGYWLVASDGGVFSFGDAEFHGSEGGEELPAPIVGIAADATGVGYWLAGADGQVYAHGTTDHGGVAEQATERRPPTVAIATPGRHGYWLLHGTRTLSTVRSEGPAVEALQRRLRDLGYFVGGIDGEYGTLTEQAVYAFQKYEGLTVDGAAGPRTRATLEGALRPVPRSVGGDVIEVDKTRQLLLVVRDGRTLWAFNTSTGTENPYTHEGREYVADTPPGRWTITREIDGYRTSNLGRLYRPKYFHRDGIAIHGYPFVPPTPASHGCVRVTNTAIDFLWSQGLLPIGAEVWVYGETPPVPPGS